MHCYGKLISSIFVSGIYIITLVCSIDRTGSRVRDKGFKCFFVPILCQTKVRCFFLS